jgi:hypothetical protein
VKDNRGPGDKLLGMILERLVVDETIKAPQMKQIELNSFLELFFFHIMGQVDGHALVDKVYATSNAANPVDHEKVADIVEALLHITMNAHFMESIVAFFFFEKDT